MPVLVLLAVAASAIPVVRSVVRQAAAVNTGTGGVITAGGTVKAQSSTHRVSGALGQLSAGRAQSATRQVQSGIWSAGACDCRYHGDTNADGYVNVFDVVEIVSTVVSADDTVARAAAFAGEQLGKTVVHAKDRAGFIVNKLLCPYLFEAIRMLEEGFASREDIDAAMVGGVGYRMGPLALSDLIGNDTLLAVSDAFMAEYQDSRYAAPPLLRRMVEAGLLGRKTGRGFYDYD